MKTKHTPTPWIQNGDIILRTMYGGSIADCSTFENAQHIVKCVNMHDAIVAKLVTSLSALTLLDKENQFEDLRENIESLIEKANQ
jgi:hypothetical protein